MHCFQNAANSHSDLHVNMHDLKILKINLPAVIKQNKKLKIQTPAHQQYQMLTNNLAACLFFNE